MSVTLTNILAKDVTQELLRQGITPRTRVTVTISPVSEEGDVTPDDLMHTASRAMHDYLSDPDEDAVVTELCKRHSVSLR